MNTKRFLMIAMMAMMTVAVVYAEPFALQAIDHCMGSNDAQLGPDSTRRTTISDVRNYQDASTTRRRVAFYSYDISALKQPGKVFADCFLTLNVDKGTSGKNLYVYAVKEELDNIVLEGKTWNTLPGLKRNPAPERGSEITMDWLYTPELHPLLMSFPRPTLKSWESSPISAGLDNILNSDTDGNVLLMFITYDTQNSDFEICSPSHANSFSTAPTTIKGIVLRGSVEIPSRASAPVPANNSGVGITLPQLSWTNPEPNGVGGIITCDVYLGTVEPNLAKPGYNLAALALGTSAQSVALPAGTLQRNMTYYWIVDVHDTTRGMTQGVVWTFNTHNNAPVVTSGGTQYLWLNNAGDPSSATAILSGSVTDDGYPAPFTLLWEQVSGPAVTINPANVLQTAVTLPQAGDYLFRLTADDGDLQSSGLTQVLVRANACLAAQAKPGYAVIPGDFNNDCIVNLADFAALAGNWLKCNSLMPCE